MLKLNQGFHQFHQIDFFAKVLDRLPSKAFEYNDETILLFSKIGSSEYNFLRYKETMK